jgi:hypothetical protein
MESVDFASAGYDRRSPWLLDWNPAFLEDPLFASVRLLMNSKHPKVQELAGTMDLPEPTLLETILRYDVSAQLLRGVLGRAEFVEAPESYPAGSIGAHCCALLQFLFPGKSASELANELKHAPGDFEARLKAAIPAV